MKTPISNQPQCHLNLSFVTLFSVGPLRHVSVLLPSGCRSPKTPKTLYSSLAPRSHLLV